MGHQLSDIDRLTVEIRERNTLLGWRDKGNTFGDYIALLHSEVTEAVEAYRDHKTEDATEIVYGSYVPKPEGVGSEFADVAIRLLDMADVFGYPLNRLKLPTRGRDPRIFGDKRPKTFGDWCAYLHMCITDAYVQQHYLGSPEGTDRCLEVVIESMERVCAEYGIDLDAEVARKMAYNATRPYRHGRGTLATVGSELGPDVDWRHTTENHGEHTAGQFPATCTGCAMGGGVILGTHGPTGALILDVD